MGTMRGLYAWLYLSKSAIIIIVNLLLNSCFELVILFKVQSRYN